MQANNGMKIQHSNNINFKSQPLFQATLRKKTFLNIPIKEKVFISELDLSDTHRLKSILEYWKSTRYGADIIRDALMEFWKPLAQQKGKNRFFVVESSGLFRRGKIYALASIEQLFAKSTFLELLQSEREIKKDKAVSGAGSCLIYMLSKFARIMGSNEIFLNSSPHARSFYKKLGFHPKNPRSLEFKLFKKNFANLESKLEKKYSIKPILNSKQ